MVDGLGEETVNNVLDCHRIGEDVVNLGHHLVVFIDGINDPLRVFLVHLLNSFTEGAPMNVAPATTPFLSVKLRKPLEVALEFSRQNFKTRGRILGEVDFAKYLVG